MYKPKKANNDKDIINYIEDNDVYNSAFIRNLSNLDDKYFKEYSIKKSDTRIDIISDNLYGSYYYMSLLYIINKLFKTDDIPDKIKYLDEYNISALSALSCK